MGSGRRAFTTSAFVALLGCLLAGRSGAGNLLANPDFDQAQMVAGWGNPGSWSSDDVNGDPLSGSMRISASAPCSNCLVEAVQCVTISPGVPYDFVAYARVASGQPAGNVYVSVIFSTACGVDGFSILSTPSASATGDWEKLEVGGVAPVGAQAAFVDLTVERTTASGTLDAYFDSVFLPEPEMTSAAVAVLAALGALGRRRAT